MNCDPRDATIAALKAEVERIKAAWNSDVVLSDKRAAERDRAERDLARHKRALAAGPAALREVNRGRIFAGPEAAEFVEAAQRREMEEG